MKKENEGVLNDNLNYDDLLDFNRQWIPLTFGALKDNGSWYCWGIDEPLMDIYSNILKPMQKENKITFRNLITWDKGNGQGQNAEEFRSYPIADEKCLFVMCGVQGADGILDASETLGIYLKYMTKELAKSGLTEKDLNEICNYKSIANHWTLNKDGSQKQPRLIQKEDYLKIQKYCQENNIDAFKKEYDEIKKEYDEIKKEYDEIKKEWYEARAYFDNTHDNMNNVWHFDRTSSKERELTGGHATPKPIALCARAIKSSSREEEIVLDVFGGSGSTLIACEQLNRKCYMCELDPHYCDVIINRYMNLTGKDDVYLIKEDGTKTKYTELIKEDIKENN
jgi:DNA modification methylase